MELKQVKDKKLAEFREQFSFLKERNTDILLKETKQKLTNANILFFQTCAHLQTFQVSVINYQKILKKYVKTQRKHKTNWSKQQIQLMFYIILGIFYQQPNQIIQYTNHLWSQVSKYLYIRTPQQVKLKCMSMNKNALSESILDQTQELLFAKILKNTTSDVQNPKWSKITYQFNKESPYIDKIYRSSKVLKKYWIQNLCQVEKGVWKFEQDEFLLQRILEYGKKWSKISKLMKNTRTQYAVKNRYYTIIQKQLKKTLKLLKSETEQNNLIQKILKKIRSKLSHNYQIQSIQQFQFSSQIQISNKKSITSQIQIQSLKQTQKQAKCIQNQSNPPNLLQNSYSNLIFSNIGNIFYVPTSGNQYYLYNNSGYLMNNIINENRVQNGCYIIYEPRVLFM